MAITDYIPNIFGSAAPTTYDSLQTLGLISPQQLEQQKKTANIQGLLGAGLALAQGMSKIGPRRSAAENIFGALAGGFGAAGGAYQQGLQNIIQQQQLQSAALQQQQAINRIESIKAAKLKYPDLAPLADIDTGKFAEEVALRERLQGFQAPTGQVTADSLRAEGKRLSLAGPNFAQAAKDAYAQADKFELTQLSQVTGNETVDQLMQMSNRAIVLGNEALGNRLLGIANAKSLMPQGQQVSNVPSAQPQMNAVPAFIQGQVAPAGVATTGVTTTGQVTPQAPVSDLDAQISRKTALQNTIAQIESDPAKYANNPLAQKTLESARASLPLVNEEIKRLKTAQVSKLTGKETPEQLREFALFADGELGNKSLADELRNRANIREYELSQQPTAPNVPPAEAPPAEAPVVSGGETMLPQVLVTRQNKLPELERNREVLVKRNEFLRTRQNNPLFKNELDANDKAIAEIDKQRSRVLSSDLAENLPTLKSSAPTQFHNAIDNLQASISTGEMSVKDATNEIATLQNKIAEYNQKELEFKRAQTNYQDEAYRVAQEVAPGVDPKDYTPQQIAEIDKRLKQKKIEVAKAGRALLSVNVGNKEFEKEFGKSVAEGISRTHSQAISAQQTLSTISSIRPLIQEGVYSGPLSTSRMYIDRLASSLGFTSGSIDEKLARTSQAMQGLASLELSAAEAMKGQGAITENERALIARAAAGNFAQFTSKEVLTLFNALEKTANSKISAHNKNLSRLRKNKTTAGLADYFELEGGNSLEDAAAKELERRRSK